MLQIAVCDDHKRTRDYLVNLIKSHDLGCSIHQFGSATRLLESAENFDILLLDIGLQDMTGIEAAREIRKSSDAVILFITALKEYVFDAFDVGAFHYLLKPIDEDKFHEVFARAAREAACAVKREPLIIKTGGSYRKIPVEDIYYAENRGRKIVLHMRNAEVEFYGKMVDLEERLCDGFYRCHRGYLVNLQEVVSYDTDEIELCNGEKVFLAKQKYHDFVNTYLEYLK